jgi:alkanesulfonate monooxygenase SsuD/methylene tetrahydromethanopterin reductase-like flavin-dependent oxidoreductase (luciferase family)
VQARRVLRFALELSGAGATAHPRDLAELAQLAEASGWHGVFLEDYIVHHSAPGIPTTDPVVALAAMAMSTTELRLGTAVTPLSRRRPWKVAREFTTLDHLSDGRMVLAVGLGDTNDPVFRGAGEESSASTRAQLLDESLEIIAGLCTGEPFSFSGRHYRVEEMTFQPTPLQKPRFPIWIGGGWPNPGVKRRALRWDGTCAYMEMGTFDEWQDQTPEYVAEVARLITERRGSREGYDIVTGGRSRGHDWDADREIIARLDDAGATWWVEYIEATEDLAAHRKLVARGPLHS